MKNVIRILSILLVLVFAFGISACGGLKEEYKLKEELEEQAKKETSSVSNPKYPLEGESGCYYGTCDETLYWYGNKQETKECKCFVFEYNGCYYLLEASSPEREAYSYQTIGPEKYFAKQLGGKRYKAFNGSYDASSKTATYMVKSVITDAQYLSKTYTLKFDGNGGISATCKTMDVYNDKAEPYETWIFTGKRK